MINEVERKQGEEHVQKDSTPHGKNLRVHQEINSVCVYFHHRFGWREKGYKFTYTHEALRWAASSLFYNKCLFIV